MTGLPTTVPSTITLSVVLHLTLAISTTASCVCLSSRHCGKVFLGSLTWLEVVPVFNPQSSSLTNKFLLKVVAGYSTLRYGEWQNGFSPMLTCQAREVTVKSLSHKSPNLILYLWELWAYPATRTTSLLSRGLLGLLCGCGFRFPSPWGAEVGAVGCFLHFSALSFCFSLLFSCPVTSFRIPCVFLWNVFCPLFSWLFSFMELHGESF